MEQIIRFLNDAPASCADCRHSVYVRDPYATGDSPSVYECGADVCEFQEAIEKLADEYVSAEYSLSDIDEDSAEFESIAAVLEQADAVFSNEYGWRA